MVESRGGQAIANWVAVAEQAELRTKKNETRLVVDVGPLARIIRERSWFVNNAPTGTAPPHLSVSTGRTAGSRLALSEAPLLRGEVEARGADYSCFVNNPG